MLVLNKVEQLTGIGLSDEFEGLNLQRRGKLSDNLLRALSTESLFEEVFCVGDTAFGNVLLCKADFVKLVQPLWRTVWRSF